MPITVQGVPSSFKRRGVFIRMIFGGSAAAAGAATWKLLLVGQMLATDITTGSGTIAAGTATVNTAVLPAGPDDADELFGLGSELALMYRRAARAAPAGIEIWCAPSPAATGTATQTLTFATDATGPGTATVEIGDESYTVAIAAGDSPAVLAGRLVGAVNTRAQSRVWADNASGVVTLHAKTLGPRGTQVRVWSSISRGIGTTLTLAGATLAGSGLVDESLSTLLANIFPRRFHTLALAATDAPALAAVSDHLEACAGPTEQRRQCGIVASVDTQGAATTQAQTGDEALLQLLWQHNARWMTGEIAAAWGAARTLAESVDPNAVLVGVEVPGLPPQRDLGDLPSGAQISACLDTGVTPLVPGDGGTMLCERSITTRSLAGGLPNYGVLDTNKVRVPMALADLVQQRLGLEFAQMRIEADPAGTGATDAPPQGTTRPSRIAAAIDAYRRESEGTLIPTGSVDASPTTVTIDPDNAQRALFEMPVDVLDWLVSIAGNVRQTG